MSTTTTIICDVKNFELADLGQEAHRVGEPVDEGSSDYPQGIHQEPAAQGIRVSACLHVTAETANLMIALPTARRCRPVRVEIPCRPRMSSRQPRPRLQHSDLRYQRRGQRFLLLAHHGRSRPIVRRSPWMMALTWSAFCTQTQD